MFKGVFPAPPLDAAPYGLLSAANVINYSYDDSHWSAKMDVETEACYFKSDIYDICDPSNTVSISDETDDARSRTVWPFAITATDQCSTFGWRESDREARVLRQLEAITSKAVETEFWTGELALALAPNTNQFLTDDDVTTGSTVVGGGALTARRALAALEQALATCGSGTRGMIHMPPYIASLLNDALIMQEIMIDGVTKERLSTRLGTLVAAGPGYSGTDPGNDAPAAGHLWMYATGIATVHLGAPRIIGETKGNWVKISDNDMALQAERPAAVVWDGCCHFAVDVDLATS